MRGTTRWAVPLFSLVAGLGEGGNVSGRQLADDGEPGSLGSLPGALILTAHIGPVDQLVAVGRRTADGDGQSRIGHRLEAHGHLAKVQIHISDILPGLHGDSVQAEGVVAASGKYYT